MREQFRKKEIGFKNRIKQLNQSIALANENCREKATELSFAYATSHNEYAHLEKSQREKVMKKDLQIKLLKDRIGQLQEQQLTRLQNGPISAIQDRAKVKQFLTTVTKLYRNKQLVDEKLSKLQAINSNDLETPDAMVFSDGNAAEEEGFSTADSLSSTYQSVGSQSMLFDIMQSKLSDNVLPVTSQHIAIGQHCIDMLTRKDKHAAGAAASGSSKQ